MTDVINKMWTAIRGSARELGDAVVDANGVRIFEQEIIDAQNHLTEAKRSLTDVMANRMQTERRLNQVNEAIRRHEMYAKKALDQSNEKLALEVATKIADLENEHGEKSAIIATLDGQIEQLKAHIRSAEKMLKDHERELALVRTTDNVQKATVQVVENISTNNSTLNSARDSLERIKKKQQLCQDKLVAGEVLEQEFAGKELESKLEAAGIKGKAVDAQQVLARLRENA